MEKVIFKTIDEYHAFQNEDIRKKLEVLRQAIKEIAPSAIEVISYGMPAFKLKTVLVYYAVNKNHIGFYPTPKPIVHFFKELKKYNTTKGSIKFPIDKPLPLDLIKQIVKFRMEDDTHICSK